MNYIIVDLEATCEKDNKNFKSEIIEIGAVKLNQQLELLGTYASFVKPIINPILTDFCKELTTITQEQIDNSSGYNEVIKSFTNFIEKEFLLISWGAYDKKQFIKDCKLHNIDSSFTNNHLNLKEEFGKSMKVRPCGMAKTLHILNIPLEGTHHRGIDDAVNIAKIFKYLKEKDLLSV